MGTRMIAMGEKRPSKDQRGGRKEARFMLRAEQDWLDRIEHQANRFGLTVAAYIRQAASQQLERDESTDPGERD